MSIESCSLNVPRQQRTRYLDRARLVAERARALGSSELELELALRVLSVLYGAASAGASGGDS